MGKGAAKFGYKSGLLPNARSILKRPTIKQTDVLEKLQSVKPKGPEGVGYADNIAHPKGSHRVSAPIEIIDVEKLISSTVPEPQQAKVARTVQQEAKQHKAQLRREYLSEAFRAEEKRVLRQAELLKKKEASLAEQRQVELAALNESRSSDLTLPTMDNLLRGPLMRQRTPEEKEILEMKRKQNRDVLQLRAKERKLENLLKLYHVSDEFIVSESQLLKKIDEVFANESSEALRTKLSVGNAKPKSRNEKEMGDALFGSLGGGNFVGLPTVKDYVSGELNSFAKEVEAQNQALIKQKQQDMDTIL
ncbi:LAME_0D03532g1_1 [Lachancea meyersii CBS 8951]|uniref:LAME_0D03532g1_1 n=1 Tax=Lachancea meyersii CBS 8951 TaxID=1266667 RepID=A0A1G4J7L7_9SACH|nr:LAME_0D03532g1_1 [Lachancea meyersii CBS 8951]